jgi:hypothetical protein
MDFSKLLLALLKIPRLVAVQQQFFHLHPWQNGQLPVQLLQQPRQPHERGQRQPLS